MGIQLRDRYIPYTSPSNDRSIYKSDISEHIVLVYKSIPLANIKVIKFSITREMAPIYQLGSGVDAISFGRGMRGIAGELEIRSIQNNLPKVFDIHIGRNQGIVLRDVEIIEEGTAIDMNNVCINRKYTFIARECLKLLDFDSLM